MSLAISKGAEGYRGVKETLLQRIRTHRWPPGSLLPGEIELAGEFGVARGTVNGYPFWTGRFHAPRGRLRLTEETLRMLSTGREGEPQRLTVWAEGFAPASATKASTWTSRRARKPLRDMPPILAGGCAPGSRCAAPASVRGRRPVLSGFA